MGNSKFLEVGTLAVDFGHRNYEDLVREGILAARTGRKALGRRLLFQATQMRPTDPRPWLWLSETTNDLEERREFLERAIGADPSNVAARRGLALLSGLLDPAEVLPEGEGATPQQPESPEPATAQVFACPQCGGRMNFHPGHGQLVCEYCHYVERQEDSGPAEAAEQTMDLVLPTARGHLWAQAQHKLACSKCGAVELLKAGVRTARCAYCGSNQLVESPETRILIDPQVIVPQNLNEEQARQAVMSWLKDGLYTPDDLSKTAKKLSLRPAYYPFWTFDGTLEAQWRCEVREGSGDNARWVPRNGTEFVLFDDVLIPGWSTFALADIEPLLPFDIKNARAFEPGLVAGWPALTYDRSMADASLLAREKVVRDLRKVIRRRVAPGSEKRDMQVGGGKWSGMSFKYALLPIWAGSYHYDGKEYRFLINGQSGTVGGQRPKDRLKQAVVWGLIAISVLAVLGLLLLIFTLFGDQIAALFDELAQGLAG